MMDLFIFSAWLMMIVIMLSVAGFVAQLVIERFLTVTLPIILEFYARIRYPSDFSE